MRLACLVVPGFRLQVHVRSAPHLAGTSFAVLAICKQDVPRVTAASRLAREAGVRPGMTGTQARAVAPSVNMIDGDDAAYRAAMEALGEAALGLSVTVDIGTEGRIYALLPPRGTPGPFGERLVAAATTQGLSGRVGIADDRFTAWAATQVQPRQLVRVVPGGGSAKFLAPLPLGLLPIDVDVQRTLGLLGVKTLGDFARLPPPTVGRRWAAGAVDGQTLARGEDRTPLHGYLPTEPIRERLELEAELVELEPLSFVLRPLFERVAARLAGRGKAAARTILKLVGHGGIATAVDVVPTQPTTAARTLLDLARAHLAEKQLAHAVESIEILVAEEGEPAPQELELFPPEPGQPDAAAVDVAVARLAAAFGEEATFGVRLADRHRPERAYDRVGFALSSPSVKSRKRLPRVVPVVADFWAGGEQAALRLVEPPASVDVERDTAPPSELPAPPRRITVSGASHEVVAASGPTRLEGEWWTDEPLARDYYEVELDDGARYWVFRDHADDRFYLHGVFD